MRLHLLTCGETHAPAGMALRGAGPRHVRFPALVTVIEHPDGPVVVDTGYAPRVLSVMRRPSHRAYGAVLPIVLAPGDALVDQLPRLGIDPGEVRTVVLTHLHPDHVGGLADLPGAQVVLDPRALVRLRSARGVARALTGYVDELIPSDLTPRDPSTLPQVDLPAGLGTGGDVTGDGTVVVVPLPGHHPGHQGVLVRTGSRDVLLVGDAVWNLQTVTRRRLPSRLVRAATDDWSGYVRTVDLLRRAGAADDRLMIVPSHDADAIEQTRQVLR